MPIIKRSYGLKSLIVQTGMDQKEVAKKLGTSESELSLYCSGKFPVPMKYINKLSKVLKVPEKKLVSELNVMES